MGAVIWAASAAAGLVAAAGAGVWRVGAASQQPKRKPFVEEPLADAHCERVVYRSGGTEAVGWLLTSREHAASGTEAAPLPTVVVAHGWASNRSRVLRYAQPLYMAGYAVFLYDARSHGESGDIKGPSAFMFRDDVLAAVEQAKRLPQVDAGRIAVLGHSLGGYGAVLALAEGLDVQAIVTDSMPVKFEAMIKSELARKKLPFFPLGYLIPPIWLVRSGISMAAFKSASVPDTIRQYAGQAEHEQGRTPLLLIHSDRDPVIPAGDMRAMVRELPDGLVQTLFLETEGHSASETSPLFWREVLPFLKKQLARR